MALETNLYRRAWADWLPGALPLLEAEQYAQALATFPKPPHASVPMAAPPAAGERRTALFTSSGAYDRLTQAPFAHASAIGDSSLRYLPLDLPDERIAFAHGHYDQEHAEADREVIVPRRALAAAGAALTPTIVSSMGYAVDWPTLLESTIPQVLAHVRADGANTALLVPV